MPDAATSPTFSATEPSGIAGWLLLPALAMLISPFKIAYDFYQSFFPILKPSLWFALLSTKSALYNPALALLLSWEIILNIVWLGLTIWLAFLFFKKQKQVPKLYVAWLGLSCILQIADIVFGSFVPGVVEHQDGSVYKELAKSALATAIWAPYFITSKRVKNTFVNDAKIKLPESDWP
ncbi:DUF2569 domain-containing protein [Herminiimonas fonticola]|uniref:Uncharacterized protein DUF2569 n=1 Tax=Herminiimonas fonticola TaxID=303380 RepID=A0A4R6G6C6_9BURK|nr:DUF2569 domain-containing protein [Herminiimonas fonticola]RBA23078.1 Protein of unknown function (DUF2569) [Herminiimonas fonticola]TDN89480.1 uncharacterized protein DUF2569 [Herminiimonas fonticola]